MTKWIKNIYSVKKGPDEKTIHNLFNKFKQISSLADDLARNEGYSQTIMTPKTVQAVEEIAKCCPW